MARKTDTERLEDYERKIEQLKNKKQRLANQLKEKERKERTRRLIQIGAIFEKYFDIEGVEQAEQYALGLKQTVKNKKDQLNQIDIEKTKQKDEIILFSFDENEKNTKKSC